LEEVRLAGAARSQFDGVVVRHNERDHASEQHILLTVRESVGLKSDASE
jgi:hypothetical protein